MNRYLKIQDQRIGTVEWLVRLVAHGATYTDMRSGVPEKKVANRDESHVLEVSVRSTVDADYDGFTVVGAGTPDELSPSGELPTMVHSGFPVYLGDTERSWIQAWSEKGFPYGGTPSNPAIVDSLVVAAVDSGTFKRFPLTVFTTNSKGHIELEVKAIQIAQGSCSHYEGGCQMLTYRKAEADKLSDGEIMQQIIDVCQGD